MLGSRNCVGVLFCGLVGLEACAPASKPKAVDPFDCEFISNSGFPLEGAALTGDVNLTFTDKGFGHGTAPARMKGEVVAAGPNWLALAACGRDANDREWQIFASWTYLPQPYPAQYPLDFPAGPRWTGPVGNEMGLPGFAATLELCGDSCSTREWVAFAGPEGVNSSIKGSAHIDAYDFCTGIFTGSAELEQTSLSRMRQGPMSLSVNATWTPDDRFYTGIVGEESGHPVNTICPTGGGSPGDPTSGGAASAGADNAVGGGETGGGGGASGERG